MVIPASSRLHDEIAHRLSRQGEAIVLERVARGAGQTRWWSCTSMEEFAAIYGELLPGSRVGLFFHHPDVTVARFTDEVAEQITSFAIAQREVLFGVQNDDDTEFDANFFEHGELLEVFAEIRPGARVLFGSQPATQPDDHTLVFTPPDADGVVRPQPV